MDSHTEPFEAIKHILANLPQPELLDDHPWTRGLFVQAALSDDPACSEQPPGQQLLIALAGLFPLMQPAAPPREGKRLDSRWGEFGLLAALYYAPLVHGMPLPTSLRDAWARIDQSIQLCLTDHPARAVPEADLHVYRLVADEPEIAPVSTISDWHRKGLERFAEIVLTRERSLAANGFGPSPILDPGTQPHSPGQVGAKQAAQPAGSRKRTYWRVALLGLAGLLLLALTLAGVKLRRVYQAVALLEQDISALKSLQANSPGLQQLIAAGPDLQRLQTHVDTLEDEVAPYLWLAPYLGWVPEYGCDLASSPALLDLVQNLSHTALLGYQAALPLMESVAGDGTSLDLARLTEHFVHARPQYRGVQAGLDRIYAARGQIDSSCLSPRLRVPLETQLDPLLPLLEDGLSAAVALPRLLGAGDEGPKTYLVLVQNSDELRATGGFITAVGSFVLNDGELLNYQFETSEIFEDWTKPYPQAPWQYSRYMDIPVLVLRDANWFSHYPTTALWAETLYAYTGHHSVDGVVAIDQQVLIYLLQALGPLTVAGENAPVTHENVVRYMRTAKEPPPDVDIREWIPNRKEFIGELASAILDKLFNDRSISREKVARALLRSLNERHILLQVDDPGMTDLLARHAWDGALRPGTGDFLMVVDTNVGYNKTNAVVTTGISYDIDLSDPTRPTGSLVVFHDNQATGVESCQIKGGKSGPEDQWLLYKIDRCYWDYLRIYLPQGASLKHATPHTVPAEWTLRQEAVRAQVDLLEEEIEGVTGFGTLLVVPGQESLATSFDFALPERVVVSQSGSNLKQYSLKIQKQPGTLAVPVTLRVHLPEAGRLVSVSPQALVQENNLLIETDLRTDLQVELVFEAP
jgi:hypothetical protein